MGPTARIRRRAFYSVLGTDLAQDGVETVFKSSGFDQIVGEPRQSWYHWGEIWLAAAVGETAPIGPTFARHYVVLPLLLLAIAGLTAVVFGRLTRVTSRRCSSCPARPASCWPRCR